jgi:hypothetical protein
MTITAKALSNGWKRYTELFGDSPHGTVKQMAAMLEMSKEHGIESIEISLSLASKIATVVVHADELLSPDAHVFDREALRVAANDPEVQAWIKELGPLAPVKRRK